MNHLEAGRILMGDSLAVHIIFALLGVGLPFVISIFEFIAIRRNNKALLDNVRLWSYVAGVLVITGVLSGTVVALQMFLIWPGIQDFGGKAISPAFMLEGYAFILEATFLTFYLKSWGKITGYKHWLLSLPIVIGATLSAFLITSVVSWMNHPVGISLINGEIVEGRPWEAIFSTTSLITSGHSILGYYMTAVFVMTGAYAWVLFRNRKLKAGDTGLAKFIIQRTAVIGLVLLAVIAVFGDLSGKYLAKHEPTKLAALELRATTGSNAPLTLGGTPKEDGSAEGGVNIPGMLSFLVGNSTDTVVQGLDQVPRSQWPPLIIHTLFDIKLLLIGLLAAIPAVLLYGYYRAKRFAFSKGMMAAAVSLPFISVAVIELGWVMAELGRQPYAVYGHLLTRNAYTTSQGVLQLAWLFPVAYVILLVLTIAAVRVTISRYRPNANKGGK